MESMISKLTSVWEKQSIYLNTIQTEKMWNWFWIWHYGFSQPMPCLYPKEITSRKASNLTSLFNALVTELYDNNWITSIDAEKAEK